MLAEGASVVLVDGWNSNAKSEDNAETLNAQRIRREEVGFLDGVCWWLVD